MPQKFRRISPQIGTQISGYLLANWLQGWKLTGVLYDVIRKPEIRPKARPQGDVLGR